MAHIGSTIMIFCALDMPEGRFLQKPERHQALATHPAQHSPGDKLAIAKQINNTQAGIPHDVITALF